MKLLGKAGFSKSKSPNLVCVRRCCILTLVLLGFIPRISPAIDVQKLVEELKKAAAPGGGIGIKGQRVAIKLQSAGPVVIPYLLALLRDKNEDVKNLASYTLSDMEGLTEQHLDALLESCRLGAGWNPTAIARIGSPRSVEFLIEELLRERETNTQFTCAVSMLGEKAVPQLMTLYQTEDGWDDRLEQTMACVFSGFGERAVTAIDPLLKIAEDETASPSKRRRAINALGSISLRAERAVPNLQKLQKHDDLEIRNAAVSAILCIGSVEAVPILVEKLGSAVDQWGRRLIIAQIGALRDRGVAAGPEIAKYFDNEDWDVRIVAERTVGAIGYEDATDDLIRLLDRTDDWRLVFTVVKSLELLKAKRALPALSQISKDHWYPPVRKVALAASKAIREGAVPKPELQMQNALYDEYETAGDDMESLKPGDEKSLRFPMVPTLDRTVMVAIERKNQGLKTEQWRGVKVEDGYLAGCDRGEWGGEIAFVDLKGNPLVIAHQNARTIYKTADGIVAVTGLAHLSGNNGFLFKVGKGTDGVWTATKWRALPGAPRLSRLLKDGRLFICCYGGIVLISPNGGMKSLSRRESLKPFSSMR